MERLPSLRLAPQNQHTIVSPESLHRIGFASSPAKALSQWLNPMVQARQRFPIPPLIHTSSFPMDWQAQYASGETPWDKSAPHPALLDFIAGSGPFQGRILIPGCGLGHDVRAISTPANEVVALDIAPAAIEKAQTFPPAGREKYITADLFDLPPSFRASFHWIIEHTCFCAIDPAMRPAYARSVAAALSPGGHLLAIFYLNPATDHPPPYGAIPGPSIPRANPPPPTPSHTVNPLFRGPNLRFLL
jgi:hypothetical protein